MSSSLLQTEKIESLVFWTVNYSLFDIAYGLLKESSTVGKLRDKTMTVEQLNEIIQNMIQKIVSKAEPKKIILFGSAVREQMSANSDLDFLVVVPQGTHRRKTARKIYQSLVGVGFAADIVVVTEQDVEQHKDNPGLVIQSALKQGKVVYAK